MTREELHNEAYEYCERRKDEFIRVINYMEIAEPREKRITELEQKNEQLVKYCKELEVGFLNYKKNYKTKRQKVFDLETRVKNLEKENEQLKRKIGVMQSCHFNSCIGCNDKKCEVKE